MPNEEEKWHNNTAYSYHLVERGFLKKNKDLLEPTQIFVTKPSKMAKYK